MSLTKEEITVLSKPFDETTIGVKVQSFSKDRTKAMLVLYLQHTDVYNRLEEVDPSWSMEITDVRESAESVSVRCRINLKGVSRENGGDGNDLKSAISDAIKRAAMLFGVGRYLYDSELVWVNYDEKNDRYKEWTYREYLSQCKKRPATGKQEQSHIISSGATSQASYIVGQAIQTNKEVVRVPTPPQAFSQSKAASDSGDWTQPTFSLSKKLTEESLAKLRMDFKEARVASGWSTEDAQAEMKLREYPEYEKLSEHQLKELTLFMKGNKKGGDLSNEDRR